MTATLQQCCASIAYSIYNLCSDIGTTTSNGWHLIQANNAQHRPLPLPSPELNVCCTFHHQALKNLYLVLRIRSIHKVERDSAINHGESPVHENLPFNTRKPKKTPHPCRRHKASIIPATRGRYFAYPVSTAASAPVRAPFPTPRHTTRCDFRGQSRTKTLSVR